jgi:hypothetical protein
MRKGRSPGGVLPWGGGAVDGVGVVGCSGGVLLSHGLSAAVPSALEGLASGFGMGPGVSPPLWPPEHRTTPTRATCPTPVWGGGCGRWDMHSGREQCLCSVFERCGESLEGVWGKSSAY